MINKKVEITWVDSKGVTSSWEFKEDIEQLAPSKITSIGYLLEDYKTIVHSMSEEQLLGRMTIPTGCILKMQNLGHA